MFPVQASNGYIQLPNGSIAYTNHPYPWTTYYYYMYRLWHFLWDHWRYIALVLSILMFGCSVGFFVYGCYLDFLVRCRRHTRTHTHTHSPLYPGQHAHSRPDRAQYMPIPDHDCEAVYVLPPQ
ncbi:hypothetical protein EON63_01505 [archaeon]|nr:MAG: hypothetical protein EON63_01505 [archaeon]